MELVKVQLGRAVWLFDVQELNPRGLTLFPEIVTAFSKRYQFAVLPKPEEIHSGNSVYFKQGKFAYDLSVVEVECELHSDGLVANTRHSTEAANAFLQDCVIWFGEQLGAVYAPQLTSKRLNKSELVVSMNPKLDTLIPIFHELTELLSGLTKHLIVPTGLDFGSEERPGVLNIERRVNSPFESNRYFSAALLQTSQHLEALSLFEKILA